MLPNADTPKSTITIQGIEFAVSTPYTEGHTLNAAEASVINQTRLENVRNNFAGTIKKAQAEYRKANGLAEDAEVSTDVLNVEALHAQLAELDSTYEFGVRKVGGGPALSPLEKEARKLAREKIIEKLKEKNLTVKAVEEKTPGWFETQVATVAARPEFQAEAKKRLDKVSKLSIDEITLPESEPVAG